MTAAAEYDIPALVKSLTLGPNYEMRKVRPLLAETGRLYVTKPLHVVAYPLGHHPGAACRCEACKLILAYRDYAPGIGRRMLRSSLEEIAAAMTRHRSEPSVEGDYFCQGRVELRNA